MQLQDNHGNVGQADEVPLVKLNSSRLFRLDPRFDFFFSHFGRSGFRLFALL
jgi:hypothetical protein